ncbi:MAG: hypothetical protein ACK46W_01855 [Bacteroidota bacterium]
MVLADGLRFQKPTNAKPETVSGNTKHDTKMEQLNLNKSNPEIEFKLNSEDSYLMIHSVSVTSQKNFKNKWTDFISQVKLSAELKYVVFDDQQGRFIDERKNQFPIHLLVDPYQVQPVFKLNKLIKNETFTLGINPERKFYRTLKLELQDVENLDEDYSLVLNIEKFKIDD